MDEPTQLRLSQIEAEVFRHVWAARHTDSRITEHMDLRALTLSGAFPDTVLEAEFAYVRGAGGSERTRFKIWPVKQYRPEPPTSLDAHEAADHIISELMLVGMGD